MWLSIDITGYSPEGMPFDGLVLPCPKDLSISLCRPSKDSEEERVLTSLGSALLALLSWWEESRDSSAGSSQACSMLLHTKDLP
ncbi:hypothetical protein I79_011312 [Cricetulus griseus]|uniref:Uncharacterized protein n=1 Tax=Cricetulus griseus TaxID=10029 RepID=G3HKT2_CRIGR|nr:hypothetical protein I79_011312 [Cricetulus griseus]